MQRQEILKRDTYHLKDKDEEKDGSSTTATHFWLELPTAVSTKR